MPKNENKNLPFAIFPDLSLQIERLVVEKNISYMEATLLWCQTHGVDETQVGEMIRKTDLKEKIQVEAEDLNFLPKTNRLPI